MFQLMSFRPFLPFRTIRRIALLSVAFSVLSATSALSPDFLTTSSEVITGQTVVIVFDGNVGQIDSSRLYISGARTRLDAGIPEDAGTDTGISDAGRVDAGPTYTGPSFRLLDRPDLPPSQGSLSGFHEVCERGERPCEVRVRVEGPPNAYGLTIEVVDEETNRALFMCSRNGQFEEGTTLTTRLE